MKANDLLIHRETQRVDTYENWKNSFIAYVMEGESIIKEHLKN